MADFDRAPSYYEDKAERAMKRRRWSEAAQHLRDAAAVTAGHSRAARYLEAAERMERRVDGEPPPLAEPIGPGVFGGPHARGRGVGSANAERIALDKYEREYRAWAAKGLHGYGPAVQWPLSPNDNRLHAIREKIGAERRRGRRNPPRRPDQHLVGYIDRPRPGQPMTDGKGRETNWVLSRVVQEYRDQFGDKSAAVILSHVRHKGRHAVGYLLIDGGSLFRGETTKESDWHDMEQEAKAEAESWAERDAEDRERDQWEQEEDD